MEMALVLVVVAVGALGLLAVVYNQRRQIATLTVSLSETSRLDPLTGLLNRRAFEELLNLELDRSRRTGRPVAVIIAEIDGMARVNAERGHASGDLVLKQVGHDLDKWKRRIDSSGRLGGEKFGVLLPETDQHGAFLVAERLRRAVRRTFSAEKVPLSISFGVASYPEHGQRFGVLMSAATRAVDAARDLGRDRSVVYCRDVSEMLDQLDDDQTPQLAWIVALAEELDIRDTGTPGHSHTVGRYSELMAQELGFGEDHVERVRLAGVLHDVGKTGVSDRVMTKPGPLDANEWRSIRTHPELGARLLAHPDFEDLGAWVLSHHERPDGQGYPHGLVGEAIPLEARILAVADAYEAMTSIRSYRSSLGEEAAAAELRAGAGTQFDANIVELFLTALAREDARALSRVS
jgi:diguanylate cyclase (GGDEF)-like protein/putative nucleotidyltransferase with HDIG domain